MPPRPSAFPEDAHFRETLATAIKEHPFSVSPFFTDFLAPWEQALVRSTLLGLGQPFHVTAWGGYTVARSAMLGLHPLHPVPEARFPFAWFRADPQETWHQLSREAVLSALEFPGTDRTGWSGRQIGDVNATDTGWCGVLRSTIGSPEGEWAGIRFTPADQGVLEQYTGRRVVIREGGSVAALRLDAIAALAHKPGRSQFKQLIENGGAMLNYKPVTKGSAAVTRGDIISLRGFLSVMVTEIGQPNKKGRLWVRVESLD